MVLFYSIIVAGILIHNSDCRILLRDGTENDQLNYYDSAILKRPIETDDSYYSDGFNNDIGLNSNKDYNKESDNRVRRSIGLSSDELISTEYTFSGSKNGYLYLKWSAKGNSSLFGDLSYYNSSHYYLRSKIFRSHDSGSNFESILQNDDSLRRVYPSRINSNKYIILSNDYRTIYTTTNDGKSWNTYTVPFKAFFMIYHKTNDDYLLFYDWSRQKLYASLDFAKTWKLIHNRVSYFFWANEYDQDSKTIHLEYLDNQGRTFYKACTAPHCADVTIDKALGEIEPLSLAVSNQYIFVQKRLEESTSIMYVSYKRGPFIQAHLPRNLHSDDIGILSTDDDLVLISATDGTEVNLYVSDERGVTYSLSLKNIYRTNVMYLMKEDIYEVKGSRGTFIVNQYKPGSNDVVTRISYNKGITWIPVKSIDPSCAIESGCSLHFHLFGSSYQMRMRTRLMVSSDDAPGLIFMHGHQGMSLQKKLFLYRSTNGGITWHKTFDGIHDIEILDHGAAILALPKDKRVTYVSYSTDEGEHWKKHRFAKTPISIRDMGSEPGMNSILAIFYGRNRDTREWTVVKVDLSTALKRKCNDSDYEEWTMSGFYDPKGEEKDCIMGSTWSYRRRKADSQCFNGRDYDTPLKMTPCKCSLTDYQCSYGYDRSATNECVKAPWFKPSDLIEDCPEGDNYTRYNGYQLIAGDRCKPDQKPVVYAGTVVPCPVLPPSHITVDPDKPMVATGNRVKFIITQLKGSKKSTTYKFEFGDGSKSQTVTGIENALAVEHIYHKTGVYIATLTASNAGKSISERCVVNVEDEIMSLEIDTPMGLWINAPTVLNATLIGPMFSRHVDFSSVHYVWTFHTNEHSLASPRLLTWNGTIEHTFPRAGEYHVNVIASNGVSTHFAETVVIIREFCRFVKLTFAPYVNFIHPYFISLWGRSFYRLLVDKILEITEDDGEYTEVEVSTARPFYALVTFIGSSADDSRMIQLSKKLLNEVNSVGINLTYPHSELTLRITRAEMLSKPGSGSSSVALYIAIPFIVAVFVIVAVVAFYYRRKLRNVRRYTMLQQGDGGDDSALLGAYNDDDDDDRLLNLNPQSNELRSNDDPLIDDDHVTGIPGSRPALVLKTSSRHSELSGSENV